MTGQFDDFLQIDAPINRGNSGGPTFNLERPGDRHQHRDLFAQRRQRRHRLRHALERRQAGGRPQLEEHGKVERGWLGVQIQEVTPAIAASLGLQERSWRARRVVTPDSPGAEAGLKQGDVILAFNGTDIAKLRDLPRLVAATRPARTRR